MQDIKFIPVGPLFYWSIEIMHLNFGHIMKLKANIIFVRFYISNQNIADVVNCISIGFFLTNYFTWSQKKPIKYMFLWHVDVMTLRYCYQSLIYVIKICYKRSFNDHSIITWLYKETIQIQRKGKVSIMFSNEPM